MKMPPSTANSTQLATTTETIEMITINYAFHHDEVGIVSEPDEQCVVVSAVHPEEEGQVPIKSKEEDFETYISIPRGADLNGYLPVTVDESVSARRSVRFEFGQGSKSGYGNPLTAPGTHKGKGPDRTVEGKQKPESR